MNLMESGAVSLTFDGARLFDLTGDAASHHARVCKARLVGFTAITP